MGIIFPNSFDAYVSNMVNLRLMASLPFASRYRLVDFVLSSMSNCGISNVAILPNRNYLSLMDHIGTGREWDLARKNGGVHIFPPFAENGGKISSERRNQTVGYGICRCGCGQHLFGIYQISCRCKNNKGQWQQPVFAR